MDDAGRPESGRGARRFDRPTSGRRRYDEDVHDVTRLGDALKGDAQPACRGHRGCTLGGRLAVRPSVSSSVRPSIRPSVRWPRFAMPNNLPTSSLSNVRAAAGSSTFPGM